MAINPNPTKNNILAKIGKSIWLKIPADFIKTNTEIKFIAAWEQRKYFILKFYKYSLNRLKTKFS